MGQLPAVVILILGIGAFAHSARAQTLPRCRSLYIHNGKPLPETEAGKYGLVECNHGFTFADGAIAKHMFCVRLPGRSVAIWDGVTPDCVNSTLPFSPLPKNPKTCKDVQQEGSTVIDPDGDGRIQPFTVNCILINQEMWTELGHNLAKDTTLKGPGNIDRYLNVNYPVSNDQIEALVTTAGQCRQYVSVRCYEMSTFSGQYWWKSRQGYDMANWGGAPTNSSKCACALSKNCAGGRQCNCNSNDGVWRSDSGYLEDSAYLPVSSLHIYDLDDSSEQSVVTLGKLQCSGAKDACTFNNGNCAHSCTAIGEQAVCSCRDGYVLAGDKFGCLDVDECSSFNGGCDHVCSNTMGGFQCSCRTGFTLDINGFTCTDNDECILNKGNCSHTCSNTEGSYRCSCPTGYTLGSDLHTCQDVNECQTGNGGCDHYCTNSQGSYSCSCRPGYKLDSDGHTCLEYMSKNTTKTCECRLRAEPPHTGLGTHLYDLTTLIYGETQLWASDDGGQSVYSVLNRFPNFYATHKRQTTGYPAAASDVDCVKVFQNCPRDCVRMTRLILGKEKLGMKVAGEVFGRLTNTTLGQNMCDKLRREIDSPGRTIAITYDPHACGNEVVTYPLSQRLCCTLVPSPVGHLLAWNSMCEDGDTFSIGNIIG